MHRIALASLALLLGALAGCESESSSSSSSGGSGAAGGSGDCSSELCAPYTCDLRYHSCRTTCASSSECIADHVCDHGVCIGTECTEQTALEQCGGYACVKGTCAHDCALGPCEDGFYCRGDTNECVRMCVSSEDPSCEGYLCDVEVGECESYCLDGELPCATGYVCDSNLGCTADK